MTNNYIFVLVALPVAGEGQNESVTTATEIQSTTVLPVDTTTESVSPTAIEAVESTTENADQTTSAVPTNTTTEIVNETTTEPAETTTEDVVQTTTEDVVQTTTEDVVQTTTEDVISTTTEDVVPTSTEPLELTTSEATTVVNNTLPAEVIKDKLSEQIRKILKHYQHPDPVGFPGAPIPDPLSIPPMNKDFGVAYMTFKNMTVHGLSKFKVENVNTDLKNMRVSVFR